MTESDFYKEKFQEIVEITGEICCKAARNNTTCLFQKHHPKVCTKIRIGYRDKGQKDFWFTDEFPPNFAAAIIKTHMVKWLHERDVYIAVVGKRDDMLVYSIRKSSGHIYCRGEFGDTRDGYLASPYYSYHEVLFEAIMAMKGK